MLNLITRCLAAVILLLGLSSVPAKAQTLLTGAGATFPHPLYAKWFRDYQSIDPEVGFTYQATGSGDGIAKILAREVDFGASDKFLDDAELKGAPGKLLQIPTVMGAVAVTYRLPGIGAGLKLTPQTLAGIYLGRITRWNDPLLVRLNPSLKLPAQDIVVLHRADSSGTTAIFTDYLSSVSEPWRKRAGKGTTVNWPAGTGAKGSGGLAAGIKDTPYSIGYVELAYALENELPTAALKNRSGRFVSPTMLATRAAAVHSMQRLDRGVLQQVQEETDEIDCRISLVNQPGKDTYPIVGLTWLLVYQQQEHEKGRKLVEFLLWELKKAEKMTSTLHYTPLPKSLALQVERTIRSINVPE
ncbi:MAG: phosphate ABC transporter substrate-binding protein PstS [Geobacter sp.]|nr:MAG: phosphate ABC transporter substrate-binding protein PstS [Geobacter sp.]